MPDKAPVILISGLSCTEELFAHQKAALEAAGYEVLIPDHTKATNMAELSSSIINEINKKFGSTSKVHMVGFSMGGYAALQMVKDGHQERFETLTLLSTNARADLPEKAASRAQLIQLAREGKMEEAANSMFNTMVCKKNLNDEQLRKDFIKMVVDTGPEHFINQMETIISRSESLSVLKDIKARTAIIVGDGDQRSTLEMAWEMLSGINGSKTWPATLAVAKDCGHLSPLEQSEAVTKTLIKHFEKTLGYPPGISIHRTVAREFEMH